MQKTLFTTQLQGNTPSLTLGLLAPAYHHTLTTKTELLKYAKKFVAYALKNVNETNSLQIYTIALY